MLTYTIHPCRHSCCWFNLDGATVLCRCTDLDYISILQTLAKCSATPPRTDPCNRRMSIHVQTTFYLPLTLILTSKFNPNRSHDLSRTSVPPCPGVGRVQVPSSRLHCHRCWPHTYVQGRAQRSLVEPHECEC